MCINHRKELNHLPSMSITARESNSSIVICRSFWNHSSVNTNPSNCASFLWDRKSHRQIDTSEDVKKTISTEENLHAADEWMRDIRVKNDDEEVFRRCGGPWISSLHWHQPENYLTGWLLKCVFSYSFLFIENFKFHRFDDCLRHNRNMKKLRFGVLTTYAFILHKMFENRFYIHLELALHTWCVYYGSDSPM